MLDESPVDRRIPGAMVPALQQFVRCTPAVPDRRKFWMYFGDCGNVDAKRRWGGSFASRASGCMAEREASGVAGQRRLRDRGYGMERGQADKTRDQIPVRRQSAIARAQCIAVSRRRREGRDRDQSKSILPNRRNTRTGYLAGGEADSGGPETHLAL